ncbi:neurosecretory protein VGF [Sphaerodactylus townsendi]|uniref:Uncharacterized protein n=1 Tax=Sphaerodactylus townsendi TaxID=933632 RepID=A0ACB8EX53_9SAUR|nr:neurosecretory protein VGF [Sphaerodactylus townsendi]
MNVDVNGAPTWAPLEVQKPLPSPALSKVLNGQRSGARAEQDWPETAARQRGGQDRTRPPTPPTTAAATKRQPHPCGRMPCPQALCRAALLLSLSLQLQVHLPASAAPASLGEQAYPGKASPKTQELADQTQVRALPEADPDKDHQDDLFQDVDPKALAAVLLQALHLQPESTNKGGPDLGPSANEERVRSETKSSTLQPERERAWKEWEGDTQSLEEEEEAPDQQEAEALKSMLQELQRYSPTAPQEEHLQERRGAAASTPPGSARNDVLRELEEYEQLRVLPKRMAPPSEPWDGARKLRQQQHLEHQLLQRRYEELAESRRQAEEARRAAAEEERLADMASDLLLQYLLKDGEQSEEEGQQGPQNGGGGGGWKGSSALLFEDEEGNVAEDKRSNEAPEEDDEEADIDPNTIDRLIELSSKLHLPANDVIDIINDVEKKKEEVPEPLSKAKTPATFAPQEKPKKNPAYPLYPQGPKPIQKSYHSPAWQPPRRLPKEDEDAWNEVLRGDEYPGPKWFHAKPNNVISNYISPRTFQPSAYHRYVHLPSSMVPREEYGNDDDDGRGHDEDELENYIEKVLMKRPRGF